MWPWWPWWWTSEHLHCRWRVAVARFGPWGVVSFLAGEGDPRPPSDRREDRLEDDPKEERLSPPPYLPAHRVGVEVNVHGSELFQVTQLTNVSKCKQLMNTRDPEPIFIRFIINLFRRQQAHSKDNFSFATWASAHLLLHSRNYPQTLRREIKKHSRIPETPKRGVTSRDWSLCREQ